MQGCCRGAFEEFRARPCSPCSPYCVTESRNKGAVIIRCSKRRRTLQFPLKEMHFPLKEIDAELALKLNELALMEKGFSIKESQFQIKVNHLGSLQYTLTEFDLSLMEIIFL